MMFPGKGCLHFRISEKGVFFGSDQAVHLHGLSGVQPALRDSITFRAQRCVRVPDAASNGGNQHQGDGRTNEFAYVHGGLNDDVIR